MTLNKTRPLIYEHKFQSVIGNYNSPYISNSNSPLFPWFHNHTHILIHTSISISISISIYIYIYIKWIKESEI